LHCSEVLKDAQQVSLRDALIHTARALPEHADAITAQHADIVQRRNIGLVAADGLAATTTLVATRVTVMVTVVPAFAMPVTTAPRSRLP
jgi:hypothetical protein